MNIKELLEIAKEKNFSIKDLSLIDLLPSEIDGIFVSIDENRPVLYLPENFTGEKLVRWKKDRGGILYKDIKNYLNESIKPEYVMFEGEGKKIIARVIDDSQIESFKNSKLLHGKIKDVYYMILKEVKENNKGSVEFNHNTTDNDNNKILTEEGQKRSFKKLFED